MPEEVEWCHYIVYMSYNELYMSYYLDVTLTHFVRTGQTTLDNRPRPAVLHLSKLPVAVQVVDLDECLVFLCFPSRPISLILKLRKRCGDLMARQKLLWVFWNSSQVLWWIQHNMVMACYGNSWNETKRTCWGWFRMQIIRCFWHLLMSLGAAAGRFGWQCWMDPRLVRRWQSGALVVAISA